MSNHHSARSQEEMVALFQQDLTTGVGRSVKHDSADKHVSGEAIYIDDRLEFPNQLHVYARLSDRAHARILRVDVSPCYAFDGVRIAITHEDIPGLKDIGPLLPGDPLLAIDKVEFVGQPVIAVAARDLETARKAAMAAIIEYEDLEPVLDVVQAYRHKHFVLDSHTHQRGDSATALASATHRIQGTLHIGGQEHFYLETQISSVMPTEDGGMIVYCSTQNPTEVQKLVAEVLDVSMNKIVVDMRRMGGGFGGKETQAASPACLCAVVARLTGQPTKMRLPRMEDMMMTGKRHPFYVEYDVGFDNDGRLHGIQLELAGNCGYSPDLSASIVDRAMFHADNSYYLGDATINGHRCKTNTASNTAYRGFGGPQGMVAIEEVMDVIARHLGKDPLAVRKANYYGKTERNVTHYYQTVEHNMLEEMTAELEESSDYAERRKAIKAYNANSPILKKGLALIPVKFGISFTASFLNQAGALIHIYTDGSIHLNHGGTEMGQGLNVKVAQVVAEVFQVDIDRVQITATNTDKVPNTSPTAASSGADLNGKAAQNAAEILKQRLVEFAAKHYQCDESRVEFRNGHVRVGEQVISFDTLAQQAWMGQVSLSSTGYYKTPKIFYDRSQARGRPFYYFAFGAACTEVLVDTLTGEYKMLRTDILHDVGASLNPAIDIGQVEGGYIQGMGWLTTEELVWNDKGKLMTNGPAGYKIPAVADMPADLRVKLVENRKNPEDTVFHSKAVGEPPFMLGIAAWCAIKDAVASLGDYRHQPNIDAPATPERVLWGCEQMRALQAALPEAEDVAHERAGEIVPTLRVGMQPATLRVD
ncbi:xanthine dehydrogenase molybdopterin binding subunit [Pseudomonas petrae]|uniref:Xanthine dehydrogenase molybdopterin binding subunit n=1 Tax=Pseudomonas petrae TaxID=2912190 RepID=A0ABS9IB85_9PSED|nr:xanthine dehydrogenase molybdopterin binding subunit [Pseudomonas petrae]MCF7538344.1 xanthine dehydrogenase molybdopterin binding subunit [Pseudomonas petrae]MCF7544992.1 xanthine dehydrogenase molybdopterin binding subunit [Pseudomonas petrae]MCF7555709.1 xanthine dehydrogenase molybdopterin binding subunit [Pseudomonas petrae]